MKLSEAILKGCEMTPKQAFARYGKPGVATCALGAAAEGMGCSWFELYDKFPMLSDLTKRLVLNITKRNDVLLQSREEIAAWLQSEGL
jgi:hypothetical protein